MQMFSTLGWAISCIADAGGYSESPLSEDLILLLPEYILQALQSLSKGSFSAPVGTNRSTAAGQARGQLREKMGPQPTGDRGAPSLWKPSSFI